MMRYAAVGSSRIVGTILLAALLAACATSSTSTRERNTGQPRSPEADAARLNTQLGSGYLQRGDYELAEEKLLRAVKFKSDYAPAHMTLGVLYETIGEFDRAETHYSRAYRLAPNDAVISNSYGAWLCKTGKYRESLEHLLSAATNPFYQTPALAWANAGSCARRIPDLEQAKRYYRRALEFDPRYVDALYPLAEISFEEGEYLRSRAFLQRFEQYSSHTPTSLLLAMRIEQALNDEAAARRYRNRLLSQFPDSSQARTLGAAYTEEES